MFDRMADNGPPLGPRQKATDPPGDYDSSTDMNGNAFLVAFSGKGDEPLTRKLGPALQPEEVVPEDRTTAELKALDDNPSDAGMSLAHKPTTESFGEPAASIATIASLLPKSTPSIETSEETLLPTKGLPTLGSGQASASGVPIAPVPQSVAAQAPETQTQVSQSLIDQRVSVAASSLGPEQHQTLSHGASGQTNALNAQGVSEQGQIRPADLPQNRITPNVYKPSNLLQNAPDTPPQISTSEKSRAEIPHSPALDSQRTAPPHAVQTTIASGQKSLSSSPNLPTQPTFHIPVQPTRAGAFHQPSVGPRHGTIAPTTGQPTVPPPQALTAAVLPAPGSSAIPTISKEGLGKESIVDDLAFPPSFDDRFVNADRLRLATPPPASMTPQRVAEQIFQIAQNAALHRRDVMLNPEELGRVRLSIQAQETTVHVAILVERPETLDLIRRHINQLGNEFRDLGYRDVSFEFNQNHSQDTSNSQQAASENLDASPGEIPPESPATRHARPPTTGSLDLRI